MAKNVNLLDRTPLTVIKGMNVIGSLFEDPTGLKRPLWRDYSRYDGLVNFGIAKSVGVNGFACRSTISWGYKDPWFDTNYKNGVDFGLYGTSYHVIYPDQPILAQADNWYKAHSQIGVVPRVIDLELDRDQHPYEIAAATWKLVEVVEARDGIAPIIYSRYRLVDKWLRPSWSYEQMNSVWWWLAQYKWDRTREHPGPPTLPRLVRKDRVVLHQTADKKWLTDTRETARGSVVDWDRWEIGNEREMRTWIAENWGGVLPPDPPDETRGIVAIDGLNVRSGPGTNYPIVGSLNYGDEVVIEKTIREREWAKIGLNKWAAMKWNFSDYILIEED